MTDSNVRILGDLQADEAIEAKKLSAVGIANSQNAMPINIGLKTVGGMQYNGIWGAMNGIHFTRTGRTLVGYSAPGAGGSQATFDSSAIWFTPRISTDSTVTATAYLYQSDKRLKKNIVDLTPEVSSAFLSQFVPKSYSLKADGRKSMGFIAQDVEVHTPDMVSTDEDAGGETLKSVNYLDLIAPTVCMVQHLTDENNSKDKQIASLEERLAKLEELVSKLGA